MTATTEDVRERLSAKENKLTTDEIKAFIERFQAESALTDRQAEYLVWSLGTNKTQQEIAEVMDVSPPRVTTLKQQTLSSLSEMERTFELIEQLKE